MSRLPYLKLIPITMVMAVCLLGTQSIAGGGVCTSNRQIEVIDCDHNTVGIEVLVGDTFIMVMGPLCGGVVLKTKGQPATLADFSVGEPVTVRWMRTKRGDIIETLVTE